MNTAAATEADGCEGRAPAIVSVDRLRAPRPNGRGRASTAGAEGARSTVRRTPDRTCRWCATVRVALVRRRRRFPVRIVVDDRVVGSRTQLGLGTPNLVVWASVVPELGVELHSALSTRCSRTRLLTSIPKMPIPQGGWCAAVAADVCTTVCCASTSCSISPDTQLGSVSWVALNGYARLAGGLRDRSVSGADIDSTWCAARALANHARTTRDARPGCRAQVCCKAWAVIQPTGSRSMQMSRSSPTAGLPPRVHRGAGHASTFRGLER